MLLLSLGAVVAGPMHFIADSTCGSAVMTWDNFFLEEIHPSDALSSASVFETHPNRDLIRMGIMECTECWRCCRMSTLSRMPMPMSVEVCGGLWSSHMNMNMNRVG
jgi:hypothetical protein